MSRRTIVASLAAVVLLATLTAGAALAARPIFVFQALLTGASEVPGPGDADAIGHATVMVRPGDDSVCWVLSWNRVDGTVIAAHIHGQATSEETAPPIVTFFQGVPHGGTDTDRGCTTSAAWADLIAADPGSFYVNVHSLPAFGPGAIRGQLR
jgi:hypothetical protein